MVQCFTEPLYNLKTELVPKQKHNVVTMFSSYNYISTAIFLIKMKGGGGEKKSPIETCCHCVVVQPIKMTSPFQHFL